MSLNISKPEERIEKSHRHQSKAFIRGINPGVSYEVWDKNDIGGRRWDIVTRERKVCDIEIEIGTFVVKGSVKYAVPAIDRIKSKWDAEVLFFFLSLILSSVRYRDNSRNLGY